MLLFVQTVLGAEFGISAIDPSGGISWTNAFPAGVLTLETKPVVTWPWTPQPNIFTTNATGSMTFVPSLSNLFCRLLAVDVSSNSPLHFTNLLTAYGLLETIGGTNLYGGGLDKTNYWRSWYEGGPATNACLSRPHLAFADPANNLLVIDEGSGSVLKITPAGTIHTYAGTHTNTFDVYGPGPATNISLNYPNAGCIKKNGTLYILDTYNALIRRVDTNGIMETVISADTRNAGRGLWVNDDESLIYWCAGLYVCKWTPDEGAITLSQIFVDLANIVEDERTGRLFVCDRNANRIYLLSNDVFIAFAGNGTTGNRVEGVSALQFGFNRPRDLCFLPNGGFLVSEHHPGNCIWYVDPQFKVHLWVYGDSLNNAYQGDGRWFYNYRYTPKVSKPRSVRTDLHGNIIIVENDIGFIRRINFQRLTP